MVREYFCEVFLLSFCSLPPVQCRWGCQGWAVTLQYRACVPIGQLACACHANEHY